MTNITPFILYSLCTAVFSVLAAYWDYLKISDRVPIKLTRRWKRIRFYSQYLVGYFICYLLTKSFLLSLPLLFLLGFTYWIVFELVLNALRGRYFLYIGKNSDIDLFVRKAFTKRVYNPRWYEYETIYNAADAQTLFFLFKVFGWFAFLTICGLINN